MRKLIVEEWVSLDGFACDKNGGLDFFTSLTSEYADKDQLKFLESIDLIVLGRKTYELFVDFWPNATNDQEAIADKLNELDKIVCSNSITRAPWGRWKDAQVMNGEAISKIKNLKSQPGKNLVLWGSISLAQSLMQEHLVDEYRIQICPVITGGGRALFTQDLNFNQLKLIEYRPYNTGTVFVHYSANTGIAGG